MTVAIQFQVMIVITASAATEITAHNAVPIAKCVTPPCVWDALMNVPAVMNRSVRAVQPNVRNAKKYFARTV